MQESCKSRSAAVLTPGRSALLCHGGRLCCESPTLWALTSPGRSKAGAGTPEHLRQVCPDYDICPRGDTSVRLQVNIQAGATGEAERETEAQGGQCLMTELEEGKPELEDSFGEAPSVCQALKPSEGPKRSDWWVSDMSRCQHRCARTAWGFHNF